MVPRQGRPRTARRLTPHWPMIASPEQAGPFVCGGLVSCWWACGGGWTAPRCKTDRLTFEVGLCLDLSCLALDPKSPLG